MTVSTTQSRIGYNGNGATTVFAFPYRFLANADLVVTLVRADTTQVVQTLNTDYTVTGAGDDAGGTVTMVVPPATGQQLVIVRAVPLTQETDYISGDPFPAESHERALDKLTMISQRLENLISRSVRLSDADLLVSSTILPSPIANATLVWNSTGTAIVNGVGSGEFVGLSPYMEVVLGSVDAAEARTNLGAVGLTGNETVAGVKTFSSSPVMPGNASTALQAVPKQQLDAETTARGVAISAAVSPATLAPTLLVSLGSVGMSGTSQQLTGVPSWALRVECELVGVGTNGTDLFGIQVADAGVWATSGYSGSVSQGTTAAALSTGFTVSPDTASGNTWTGRFTLERSNAADTTWICTGLFARTSGFGVIRHVVGQITVSALNNVRVALYGGASTFNAGTFRAKAGA